MSAVESRYRYLLTASIGVGLLSATFCRFIQDDAFISFRYAAHLAHGDGLVFNPGERVEGYTNFLWTLLMAVPALLNIDTVAFAHAIGLVCFVGSLLMSYRLSRLMRQRDPDALLAVLLLATNYTFICYATGGLETQLQTLLVVTATCLSLAGGPLEARRAVVLAVVTSLALLTRLDSIVLLAPVLGLVARRNLPARKVQLGMLVAIGALMIGTWMVWKLSYYGSIFPNTAGVKGPEPKAVVFGLKYLAQFVWTYWMAPVGFLAVFRIKRVLDDTNARVLLVALALWCVYLVVVGGDFMEFRLIVPALPFLFVLLPPMLPESRAWKTACVTILVLGSVVHALRFRGAGAIEPIRNLEAHVLDPDDDWRGVGRALGSSLGGMDPRPWIATTAVGAIPYYSGLPTVDMLGLTDPAVARDGIPVGMRSGHRRLARTSYLVGRHVNFVLGHPQIMRRSEAACTRYEPSDLVPFGLRDATPESIPSGARVVDLPIGNQRVVRAIYLTRSLELDDVVDRIATRSCPIGTVP